jgi:hypothetical protein
MLLECIAIAQGQMTGYAMGSYGFHTNPLYNYEGLKLPRQHLPGVTREKERAGETAGRKKRYLSIPPQPIPIR